MSLTVTIDDGSWFHSEIAKGTKDSLKASVSPKIPLIAWESFRREDIVSGGGSEEFLSSGNEFCKGGKVGKFSFSSTKG